MHDSLRLAMFRNKLSVAIQTEKCRTPQAIKLTDVGCFACEADDMHGLRRCLEQDPKLLIQILLVHYLTFKTGHLKSCRCLLEIAQKKGMNSINQPENGGCDTLQWVLRFRRCITNNSRNSDS